MKRILFICLLQLLVYAAYGQFTISGKIIDETGNPLPGANIILENTYHGTSTDLKGNFVFSKIRKGEYILKITYIGYASVNKKVKVDANVYLDISLEPAMILSDEVIVLATRVSDKVPVAFTNIDKDMINERNVGQDIPYLLSLTPSFVVSSDAGAGVGYTSFRIRGTDADRINVTINGIPLNDSESHGVWWVNLPDFASSVDNIQIQRGVGTSTNGAGAFGASINFQTFTLNKDPYAEINSSIGSFKTYKNNISLGSGLINDKFTFDVRLSKIISDGFIDRAFSDLKSFAFSGAHYTEKSILKMNILSGKEKTYQAWWGVPKVRLENDLEGMQRYLDHWLFSNEEIQHMKNSNSRTYNYYTYENEVDNYGQDHFQLFYSRELVTRLKFNVALHYTHGEGYYEQFKYDENFTDYGLEDVLINDTTISSTDLIRRKWLDNDFYGFIYSLNYKQKKIDATLGGAWNYYDGDHFGEINWAMFASNSNIRHRWYENTGIKKDFNIFFKLNYQLTNELNLFGDVQYRYIDYNIEGFHDDMRDLTQSHTYPFFNPKFGIFYNISDKQRTYFSFGIANREPGRNVFRDADEGELPKHETLHDYELGYKYNSRNVIVTTNLYFMNYKNQLVLTGEINNVGSDIKTNVPESYRVGIEMIFGAKLFDNLEFDMNMTLSRNRIRNFTEYVDDWDNGGQISKSHDETDLSFSPNIIFGSQLSYLPIKNLKINLNSKYIGKQYIDNTSSESRILESYFVNNIQAIYSIKIKWLKELGINLSVNNILNKKYETNAWVYRYYLGEEYYEMDGYFPQAGIHYLLGLSVKF